MDLRLGQRPVRRRQHGPAQVEHVARELEVEERRLVLLELRRRRQHVVGQAGRLGHEHVDHDDELEASIASRIRCESASEWAGLPVSTISARNRSGWSVRISSGITLHGISPAMIRDAGDRGDGRLPAPRGRASADERRRRVLRAGLAEVAGEQPHQLLEVADERRVAVHLDAEVLEHGDALGRRERGGPRPGRVLRRRR